MGQYHKLFNFTKREVINPLPLGVGLKMREQVGSLPFMGAWHMLLNSCPEQRGGGDYRQEPHDLQYLIVGRWAGDRVALVGDYAEDSDLSTDLDPELDTVWHRIFEPLETEPGGGYDASTITDFLRHAEAGRPLYVDITPWVVPVVERTLNVRLDGSRGFTRYDPDAEPATPVRYQAPWTERDVLEYLEAPIPHRLLDAPVVRARSRKRLTGQRQIDL